MADLASLETMLRRFGVVTCMDVKMYKTKRFKYKDGVLVGGDGRKLGAETSKLYRAGEWDARATFYELSGDEEKENSFIYLDTLKVTNINSEGPSKTATGGMTNDTLFKYGKTFSLEMTDAVGRYDVLDQLYGSNLSKNEQILAITDRFPGEYTLVGETFFIDQETGAKQPVRFVLPIMLGDGVFSLSMDAEGDITSFGLNANILRFESDSEGEIKDGLYSKGSDNLYYIVTTIDGFNAIKAYGYREAYDGDITKEDDGNVTIGGARE